MFSEDSNNQDVFYIRLSNLSRNVTSDVLTNICSNYGDIKNIEFISFEETTKLKGVAYVRYTNNEQVTHALECLAPGKSVPVIEDRRKKGDKYDKKKE